MNNMAKWILGFALVLFISLPTIGAAGSALLLNVSGPIDSANQDYIQRGLSLAKKNQDKVIILKLNTSGGLDTSMRAISKAIVSSPIPVIAYVAPAQASAASIGLFIVYASHLAAMAPGTHLGATLPVNFFSSIETKAPAEIAQAKNNAAAYIRSLAQLHDRNANWGEAALLHPANLSAEEAKKLNVINFIAPTEQNLLQQANGKMINILGHTETLNTGDLKIEPFSKDWRFKFLSIITNPNSVYILLLLAIYGMFFELANPGLIFPGLIGIIALLFVLYAFQLLPINYAGLTLIFVGITSMLFEIYIMSFGVLGIGGIIAFILGSIMLFETNHHNYHLAWPIIFSMSAVTVAFFFVLLTLAFRAQRKAVISHREGLIGNTGIVLSVINQKMIVRVLGEIWEAQSKTVVQQGEKVKIIKVKGLLLMVEPLKKDRM